MCCTNEPTCASVAADFGTIYNKYFEGQGVSQSFENPGNIGRQPYSSEFDGSLPECVAATACAHSAANDPGFSDSFDLHERFDGPVEKVWVCNRWFYGYNDAATFNVVDPNVGRSFGYERY